MKTRIAAVLLLCAAAASAAPAKKKDKPADAAPPAEEAADDAKPGAPDGKKRVEAYLAARTKKLTDAHAARLEFSARENLLWEEYWGKVRDARKTFELRTARQAVDLFSTLETLDPKDHASTVADFEKLRGTMVKSFEAQQRQKMAEFFAAREARWRQFADAQEKDRAGFAAEAEAAWQADKDFLRTVYGRAPVAAGAAGGGGGAFPKTN